MADAFLTACYNAIGAIEELYLWIERPDVR